ncbi:MAG: right-handed parallel beta-helix repeat-containing protein [Verrucomicrobia bacterium]|nr:right-handed parallel beta-helix repeat-containing protein [Verrucomicrobiota bacterium]
MRLRTLLPCLGFLSLVVSAPAGTLYVDAAGTNSASPYTSWATAASNIQAAVDIAVAGDEILVTNGVYQTGAWEVYGMSNRVAVTKPVTVRSVNGPALTQIVGYQVPGTTNGAAAVRCVYLTNGAVLVGFTLTNGATQTSGDTDRNQSGGGVWCDGLSAVVSNCVFTGNSAHNGGGVSHGTLHNCTLMGNSASHAGGGAWYGMLNNCVLTRNTAGYAGGGTWYGTLNNCTLTGNSAGYDGGGTFFGTLNNCIIFYNLARYRGANYFYGVLNNCCTTPPPACGCTLDEEPQLASAWRLSDNSPCLGRGSATYASGLDLDGEPWANAPAIGCDEYWSGLVTGAVSVAVVAADTNVAVGFRVDFQAVIEGRVSASRWDFGDGVVVSNRPWESHAWAVSGDYVVELQAYSESYPDGVTAAVTVHVVQEEHYVALTSINPVLPYSSWATAATNIQDAVDAAALPGALVWVSDGVYQTGTRAVYGMSNRLAVNKPVMVRSVNGPARTQIMGYQVPGTTNGPEAVRCVYLTDGAMLEGFTLTRGATQTFGDSYTNQSGGGVWCEGLSPVVSNCVLTGNSANSSGGGTYYGTLNNCVLAGNSASSSGGGAYYGTLHSCTLTGNSARTNGGGAYWGTLSNCTLADNSAYDFGGGSRSSRLNNCTLTGNSAYSGGGAFSGTLNNCTLAGNSARVYGGAVSEGTLNNCTLTGNSAGYEGGGAYKGTLNNCIVYYNSAGSSGANYSGGTLNYCCTTPLPAGPSNLTNAPSFVDSNGWSNLRLRTNSLCINAGNNAYASGDIDLDGRPRTVGGKVDIGAYEYQGPGMGEFIGWLQQHSLPADGSVDGTDLDRDGLNNWQEWRCGTDPANALSVLRLLAPAPSGPNMAVSWQSVAGVSYALEWSTNLGAVPAYQSLATNLPGQPGITAFTHTNGATASPRFYRVGVP